MGYQRRVHGDLGVSLSSHNMGGLSLLLPLTALIALGHGAAIPEISGIDALLDMFSSNIADMENILESYGLTRNKRGAGSHAGYKTFGPVYGVQVGLKYKDEANKLAGGEAFIHFDDLQKLAPKAHSSEVEIHLKFDGGATPRDGIFDFEIDYHLTHSDGDGVEEGELNIVRKQVGGKWETKIETKTKPFAGVPIIPKAISNAHFDIKSDRKTFLELHYVNAEKNRDIEVDIIREPGKQLEVIVKKDGAVLVDQKAIVVEGDLANQKVTLKFEGPISGQVAYSPANFNVNLEYQGVKVLQVQTKILKRADLSQYIIKVNSNHGLVKSALAAAKIQVPVELKAKRKPGAFQIEEKSTGYALSIERSNGLNFKMEQKKKLMWEYKSEIIKNVNTDALREFEAKSTFTMDPSSKLYEMIKAKYPLGAFTTRENYVHLKVDKAHTNLLLPKFLLHAEVKKDSALVLDLTADTFGKPYLFKLNAPNLRALLPYERSAEGIEITVDHDIGKSIDIKSNGFGGIEIFVSRQANSNGAWDIHAYTKKGGKKMMNYDLITSLTNDATQFKFGLTGDLTVDPASVLFKNVISNYKILTPFNKRHGEIEIFFDKQNKNAVLNKFMIHGKTEKDGQQVLDVLADFTKSPYEIKIFAPVVRNLIGSLTTGSEGILITIDHQKGSYLEVVTNLKGFSGLKITTSGNKKELEFNGQKVGSGEFQMSGNKMVIGATKAGDGKVITYLKDGDNLKIEITWATNNPQKNTIDINVKGSRRNLDLHFDYDLSNLDFNINTPSSASVHMKAVGNNPTFGQYKISRDASLKSSGNVVSISWTGSASFESGPLAARSPIETNMNLEFDATAKDLTGVMSKTFAGKEYSITFPKGTGLTALPRFSFAG